MTKYVHLLFVFESALLVAMIGGCRNKKWDLISVQGKVTRGGELVQGVQVTFWPEVESGAKGPRASAVTDANGRYELRTDGGDDGAAVGRYHVCLVAPRSKMARRKATKQSVFKNRDYQEGAVEAHPALDRIPLKYQFYEKTPLRVEVAPGRRQTFDFDVADDNAKKK